MVPDKDSTGVSRPQIHVKSPLSMGSIDSELNTTIKGAGSGINIGGGEVGTVVSIDSKGYRVFNSVPSQCSGWNAGILSSPLRRGPCLLNSPGFPGDLWVVTGSCVPTLHGLHHP